MQRLDGVNPVVYASLVTTMRYTALLRHAREQDAANYDAFLESLESVRVSPQVQTPTIMLPGPGEQGNGPRP
jgi:hypothetical protein